MNEDSEPVAGPVEKPVRPQRWTGSNIHAAQAGGFVAIGDYLALERAAAMLAVDLAEARAAVAAERDGLRAQASRDAVDIRWTMRQQIAEWLEGQGQPGYAAEVRIRDWA